jgi:predicted GNAT family acetyltransferase
MVGERADAVRDNPERQRYELAVDGETAVMDYRIVGDVLTITHTGVPRALEGRGIGSALVKGALDQIRARNLKIVVLCWFVSGYIDRHPEYASLRVG